MKNDISNVPAERIEGQIVALRGKRVMLDRDLANLYGVTTSNLNKAVQRNRERFPGDFMFQLTAGETESLIFQSGISKKRGGSRHFPHAFTQEGIAMLSSVLRSKRGGAGEYRHHAGVHQTAGNAGSQHGIGPKIWRTGGPRGWA
jgi:hypothetical protein